MAISTQPYKGSRDFYPTDMRLRDWMFERIRRTVRGFSFEEYDGPMFEPFELYAAKSGEELVGQQLYSMVDRGDRKIAVRPEMTPTLARMVAARFHELPKPVRWFAIPNLWRYERPQRGRLREFWQPNCDILGGDRLLADAEIIQLAYEVMRAFGGEQWVSIKVNHRKLMDELFTRSMGLDAQRTLALTKAIDARDKMGEEKFQAALDAIGLDAAAKERLGRFFGQPFEVVAREIPCEGAEELGKLFALLRESGVPEGVVVFDPTVMRGLDYYTGTVFEVYDTSPENRRALFGGGRYDNLLSIFGNYPISGVGFGMGDIGLQNFLEVHGLLPKLGSGTDVLVTLPKLELRGVAERLARELREAGLRVMTPLEVGGFGAQLKTAAKHQARFAVILGDSELARGAVVLKDLSSGQQQELKLEAVSAAIRGALG